MFIFAIVLARGGARVSGLVLPNFKKYRLVVASEHGSHDFLPIFLWLQ
jgi:hypothetical protein